MVTETIEKEDNIVRSEALSIPLYDANGLEVTLKVDSDDADIISVSLTDEEGGEMSAGCDTVNFIALCKRAVELWDNEKQNACVQSNQKEKA